MVTVDDYLARIGLDRPPRADRAGLAALQWAHLTAIPYENLDVQLARPRSTDPVEAADKLITGRRGGWCYEMNGCFGWALDALGFRVTRLASAVLRSSLGEAMVGNHLVLRVDFDDGPMLADVGLGEGPPAPYALAPGVFASGWRRYRLETLPEGWLRLHNQPGAAPPDFDFHPDHADEAGMAAVCHRLQTDPQSMFVQNLICERYAPDGGHLKLVGRTLTRTDAAGVKAEQTIASADALTQVLEDTFGIDEPEAASLWPRVMARDAERTGEAG